MYIVIIVIIIMIVIALKGAIKDSDNLHSVL